MAKLVRDRIPEIIRMEGRTPTVHIAGDDEYWQRLKEKLVEEANEFAENETDEELADVLEVIYAILEAKGVRKEAIEAVRLVKAQQRGAFRERIVLDRQ